MMRTAIENPADDDHLPGTASLRKVRYFNPPPAAAALLPRRF
jgi:hypothetical protein